MKKIAFIVFIMTWSFGVAQNPARINMPFYQGVFVGDTTDHGQRNGIWISIDNEGVTQSKTNYEPYELVYKLRTEEDFFFGTSGRGGDTIIYKDKVLWSEIYDYDENGVIVRTWRSDQENDDDYILFGAERKLKSDIWEIKNMGRVGESKNFQLEFENLSKTEIRLTPDSNYHGISFTPFTIPASSKQLLIGKVQLDGGRNKRTVSLSSSHTVVPLSFETYGYHIRTEDIIDSVSFEVPPIMHYYRKGGEALLNIFDMETGEVIKRIPLNTTTCEINLSKLDPKQYRCQLVNYTEDTKTVFFIKLGLD